MVEGVEHRIRKRSALVDIDAAAPRLGSLRRVLPLPAELADENVFRYEGKDGQATDGQVDVPANRQKAVPHDLGVQPLCPETPQIPILRVALRIRRALEGRSHL